MPEKELDAEQMEKVYEYLEANHEKISKTTFC